MWNRDSDQEYLQSKGLIIDRQVLNDGAKRRFGDVTIEVQDVLKK